MSQERSELSQLYDIASDSETDVLDELRARAGQIWECDHCGCLNTSDRYTCEECGRARSNPHSENTQK